MAQNRETKATAGFLKELKNIGWFRKISDRVQVGIPDILGTYKGTFFGLEIKAVSEVSPSGLAPRKSEHRITSKQLDELRSIEKNGGVGLAIVICGSHLFWGLPDDVNEFGQINCWESQQSNRTLLKSSGKWLPELMLDIYTWRK